MDSPQEKYGRRGAGSVMELPCLPLKSMLEPPKLLRRPLPPKIVPVLKGNKPYKKEKGSSPSCEQQKIQEIRAIQENKHGSSDLVTAENTDLHCEDWIRDHGAPTPAASRLNSDDYPVYWSNLSTLSCIREQHKYPITEQIHHGQLMRRGPADFPLKRRHKQSLQNVNVLTHINNGAHYQHSVPEFTFNDITRSAYHTGSLTELLNKPMISSLPYSSMEDSIAKLQRRIQDKIHNVILLPHNIPEVSKRVPLQQLALEQQQAMMKEDTESAGALGEDSLHELYKSQHFRNSDSILKDQSKILETYCDLAMLECLVHGGHALSLKAYFISKLPDLTPLYDTLFYLNLSFNEFWQFPTEVYRLKHLEFLKFRNNPVKDIPFGIHNLKKLRTLIVSFCSLSSLPDGLFLLPYLQVLDVSYNNISLIPNDISNLRSLEFLNVEGNSLPAMPCGALKLKLKQLRVGNNRMHPLFWRENTHIQPQCLLDIAAMAFAKNNMIRYFADIPSEVKEILLKVKACDCCRGALSGEGLRFIRPCEKIFGIRQLPFMFHACSPSCYRSFMSQTESLTKHLYES
ncbi:leucine-rich repeat-containing protein 63 isoform X2 [Aquarana catesbeiana]|uniref:leucine-rich repeat-containing protein 63 isoform X2 n=1 Tax=Aquarana catesbeiana TaxID=8400 RepID=UPI003CC9C306